MVYSSFRCSHLCLYSIKSWENNLHQIHLAFVKSYLSTWMFVFSLYCYFFTFKSGSFLSLSSLIFISFDHWWKRYIIWINWLSPFLEKEQQPGYPSQNSILKKTCLKTLSLLFFMTFRDVSFALSQIWRIRKLHQLESS